jgi:hypothetical protein
LETKISKKPIMNEKINKIKSILSYW